MEWDFGIAFGIDQLESVTCGLVDQENMDGEQGNQKWSPSFIQINLLATIKYRSGFPYKFVMLAPELIFLTKLSKALMPSTWSFGLLCLRFEAKRVANYMKLTARKNLFSGVALPLTDGTIALTARCNIMDRWSKIGNLIFTECNYDGDSGEKYQNHFKWHLPAEK